MITFICTSCQKKLSVGENVVGKKVKCPVCHQVTDVSVLAAGATVGNQATCTMPPPSASAAPTATPLSAANEPTRPPLSNPGVTLDSRPGPDHDGNLIDFLAPPLTDDELGRLGDYRILKILGHGGMGVVFLGEDVVLNRKVAIKAMLPHLVQSKSSQQRFLREARAAAALEHDHIVAIHHVGVDRGSTYIVMPFLKGESLNERLQRPEAMPLADMLRIGREIAKALGAAHAAGLIHRDIKPANIWLEGPAGRVKILDFGLARAVAEGSELTQQGAVIGTPAYMAPEQARGDPIDARCDLFSLGVVLYRLGSGQQPFRGRDAVSTLMEVTTHHPPPPQQLNAALPQGFSELVMKLLEKDPAQRIGSAEKVIQSLNKLEMLHKPTDALGAPPTALLDLSPTEPRSFLATDAPPVHAVPARQKFRSLPFLVACAVVASLLLLGGGALAYQLIFRTSNGTLIVEVDGDAEVRFKNGSLNIYDADGKHLLYTLTPSEKNKTLPVGKYTINVVGADGVALDTSQFDLTRNGSKVRVSVAPTPTMPDKGPTIPTALPVAEKGVRAFAEIHDAEEARFDTWLTQQKKDGYRPVRVTVQTVNDAPRYTAVALKDDKNWPWEFSRADQSEDGHVDQRWERKYEAVAQAAFRKQGKTYEVFLWAKDDSLDNDGVWNGDAPFVEGKIKAAQKEKKRLISRCAVFDGNTPEFSIIIEDSGGVAWQESYNVSFDDLKAWVEKHKAGGWRPDHLCYYGVGSKRLFGAIAIKDPAQPDWDVSWSITRAEYEKELTARTAQGFRPLTAVGHEDAAGAQRFSAIWVRYRIP